MTKKTDDVKTVNKVIQMQSDMNDLDVDTIQELAPKPVDEEERPLSNREKAALENAIYIEPKRQLKGFGTLPEKLRKEHKHGWEYVKGMFENIIVNGEAITFWLSLYPGDPDCMWEIPANKPVFVPRHVANHLEKIMEYHEFSFIEKPQTKWRPGDAIEFFAPTETKYRGKFRPIGAFA
jgi:hypothetical protein